MIRRLAAILACLGIWGLGGGTLRAVSDGALPSHAPHTICYETEASSAATRCIIA